MSSVNWGDMNKVEYFGKMGGMMISMRLRIKNRLTNRK